METPKEHLNVRLSTLKALAGQRHTSKTKREAKKLIPIFENAIKVLEEAETRKANLDIADVMPCLLDIQNEAFERYYKGYDNPIDPCDADKYGHKGFIGCGKWILSFFNKA